MPWVPHSSLSLISKVLHSSTWSLLLTVSCPRSAPCPFPITALLFSLMKSSFFQSLLIRCLFRSLCLHLVASSSDWQSPYPLGDLVYLLNLPWLPQVELVFLTWTSIALTLPLDCWVPWLTLVPDLEPSTIRQWLKWVKPLVWTSLLVLAVIKFLTELENS